MSNISNPIVDGFVPVTPVEIAEVQEPKSYTIKPMKSINFYKGTSFRWAGEWKPGRSYVSDEYFVDYAYYEGNLWVCVESHFSEVVPSDDNKQWQVAVRRGNTGVHVGTTPPSVESYGEITDKILWIDTSLENPVQKIYSASQVDGKLADIVKNLSDADTNILNKVVLNTNAITEEVTDREAAISAEANVRKEKDDELDSNIVKLSQKDAALLEKINALEGKVGEDTLAKVRTLAQQGVDNAAIAQGEVDALETVVSAETKARQESDAALDAKISAESTARDAAVSGLQETINTKAAQDDLTTLSGVVSTMDVAYKAADAELLGKIEDNTSAIAKEVADRKEAISSQDQSLRQYVDASKETYTIWSIYEHSISKYLNGQGNAVRLDRTEHMTTLPDAVKAGKVILLKFSRQSSAKYVCNAKFQGDFLYISYVNSDGDFISFFIIPTEWRNINVFKHVQHLPNGGTLGQVLTKTGERVNDIEWQTPPTTTYILPFTHEDVIEWAVASEKVGQIMDTDQAIAIDEAIKANKVVMIPTEDGYYPCSAKVVGLMVYINYLDNDGNVVAISFDGQGTFDNAEVKPIGLPAGGREDQVLSKYSDANQYAWIDLPTYTTIIQSFTAEDVKNAFHSGDESASDLEVLPFDISEIDKAMQEGKVILIRANEQSNSVYVCDAINEWGLVRITYRDTALHTVSFRFNPEEAEPHIWIDRHTSSLPSGGEAGQVLTKTGEGIGDVEWTTPRLTNYTLPFTHEQVLEWAELAPESVGQIMSKEEANKVVGCIRGETPIYISLSDRLADGVCPCTAMVEDMVYISYIDYYNSAISMSFDIGGIFDTAEIKTIGVPAGGTAGQILSKKSDNSFDTEWVDVPQGSDEGTLNIDTEMSDTSENAVQNKVIKKYVDDSRSTYTITSFTAQKVRENYHTGGEIKYLELDENDSFGIAGAITKGQIVLIKANDDNNAVYVCDVAQVESTVTITYLDEGSHIVRLQFDQEVPDIVSVTRHQNHVPKGGEIGQVLTKTGEGIDDIAWKDNSAFYTISAFSAVDVDKQFVEGLGSDLHFQAEYLDIITAVQQNKTIVIRSGDSPSEGHYICAAQVSDAGLILQYTNKSGQFITLTTTSESEPDYYVTASVLNSSLPIPQAVGQVLTVTNIHSSNTRTASNQIYDFEWQTPQGGGGTVDIVDNLTTADPTKALSANMGRALNEKFQYKNYLAGKNLDQKGNILDAEGWNVTTPIAVVGGTALTFECGGTNTSALCEYDANDNRIDYWSQNAHPRTITTKANTAYVRLAVPNNPTQDYFVAQNDVILFNKLRNFDIVEQVANLDEDAIEVTPLLSIENDIYPPHMRLIVEWSNEDAEVLQPVSYNAETDLFEVESMPSWLAEDGVIVPATINYSDTILWGTGGWQNVPFPKNNTQTIQHIKRVSATTFKALSQSVESSNQMDIIASPDCTLFSYCQAKDVQRLPLQLDGEELSGIKKFKIVIKDSNLQFGKTFCGVNSSTTQLISNNYPRVLGTYLAETRPLMVSGYMIIEVDFDNARYRYLEYQLSGLSRTGAQAVTPYIQSSKNTEQWSSIWPNTKPISQAFFLLPANALTKKCNVKIYEIYE